MSLFNPDNSRQKRRWVNWIRRLSITFCCSDNAKKRIKKKILDENRKEGLSVYKDKCQKAVKQVLVSRNKIHFRISFIIVCVIAVFDLLRIRGWFDITGVHLVAPIVYYFLIALCSWYALSRAFEIFFAFLFDAISQTKNGNKKTNSSLVGWERIQLALKSYMELILDFGILYYMMSQNLGQKYFESLGTGGNDPFTMISGWCKGPDVHHIIEAVYFSGITITTTGFGDLELGGFIPELLSLFEVITGILLLVVCFTLYSKAPENPNKRTLRVLTKKGKSS